MIVVVVLRPLQRTRCRSILMVPGSSKGGKGVCGVVVSVYVYYTTATTPPFHTHATRRNTHTNSQKNHPHTIQKVRASFWRELAHSCTSPRNQDFKPPTNRHNTKIFSQKIGPNSRERKGTTLDSEIEQHIVHHTKRNVPKFLF